MERARISTDSTKPVTAKSFRKTRGTQCAHNVLPVYTHIITIERVRRQRIRNIRGVTNRNVINGLCTYEHPTHISIIISYYANELCIGSVNACVYFRFFTNTSSVRPESLSLLYCYVFYRTLTIIILHKYNAHTRV